MGAGRPFPLFFPKKNPPRGPAPGPPPPARALPRVPSGGPKERALLSWGPPRGPGGERATFPMAWGGTVGGRSSGKNGEKLFRGGEGLGALKRGGPLFPFPPGPKIKTRGTPGQKKGLKNPGPSLFLGPGAPGRGTLTPFERGGRAPPGGGALAPKKNSGGPPSLLSGGPKKATKNGGLFGGKKGGFPIGPPPYFTNFLKFFAR